MLKRALAFLLVLVAGLLVLELAQGGKDPFRRSESRPDGSRTSTDARADDAAAQIRVSGGVRFDTSAPVTGPDGRRFTLPRSSLHADDSRLLDQDRQELLGAHVVFHEWSFLQNGDPVVGEAAQLDATRLIAGLDRKGARLDLSRDVELSGVRLKVGGRGALQGMVLTADHMRARPEGDVVHAWTEGELDPFQLRLRQNDTEYLLEGRGLDLQLPQAQGTQPVQVLVRADLRLTTLGSTGAPSARTITASCRGATRLSTPPGRQDLARLELREAVEVTVELGPGRVFQAACERLRLDLRRLADERLVIDQGSLDGTPVALQMLGATLHGGHAVFCCDGDGELQRLRLTGSPSARVPGQRLHRALDLDVTAAESIEIVDLASALTDVAALGMPGPDALLSARWIRFGGHTTARGALALSCTRGLLAALGESERDPLLLRGLGVVEVTLPEGHASGNNGFRLRHEPDGAMRFWLGPEAVDPAHAYSVRLPTGQVDGHGRFALHQAPDGTATLRLAEPGAGTIHAQLTAQLHDEGSGPRTVELDGAHSLDLIVRQEQLQSLTAHGQRLRLTDPTTGIGLAGRTFTTLADGVLCVVGVPGEPAELDTVGGEGRPVPMPLHITAMEFRLRPGLGGRVALTARRSVVLRTGPDRRGAGAVSWLGERVATLTCDELDYLPGLAPDTALELAALPGGPALRGLWLESLGSEGQGWIVARRNVSVVVKSPAGTGDIDRLRGSLLVLSADREHAVVIGPGASLRHDQADGTGFLCRASRITQNGKRIVIGDPQGNPGALLRMSSAGDLLGGPDHGAGRPTITEIVCGQPIRVTDAAIVSRGPCLLTTVEPPAAGDPRVKPDLEDALEPPPDGLRVEGSGFRLLRHPDGHLREVIAEGPVTLRRGALSAWCDAELHFDPATYWLRLSSEQDPAQVDAGPALSLSGQRIEFNLKTYAHRVWRFMARNAQVRR